MSDSASQALPGRHTRRNPSSDPLIAVENPNKLLSAPKAQKNGPSPSDQGETETPAPLQAEAPAEPADEGTAQTAATEKGKGGRTGKSKPKDPATSATKDEAAAQADAEETRPLAPAHRALAESVRTSDPPPIYFDRPATSRGPGNSAVSLKWDSVGASIDELQYLALEVELRGVKSFMHGVTVHIERIGEHHFVDIRSTLARALAGSPNKQYGDLSGLQVIIIRAGKEIPLGRVPAVTTIPASESEEPVDAFATSTGRRMRVTADGEGGWEAKMIFKRVGPKGKGPVVVKEEPMEDAMDIDEESSQGFEINSPTPLSHSLVSSSKPAPHIIALSSDSDADSNTEAIPNVDVIGRHHQDFGRLNDSCIALLARLGIKARDLREMNPLAAEKVGWMRGYLEEHATERERALLPRHRVSETHGNKKLPAEIAILRYAILKVADRQFTTSNALFNSSGSRALPVYPIGPYKSKNAHRTINKPDISNAVFLKSTTVTKLRALFESKIPGSNTTLEKYPVIQAWLEDPHSVNHARAYGGPADELPAKMAEHMEREQRKKRERKMENAKQERKKHSSGSGVVKSSGYKRTVSPDAPGPSVIKRPGSSSRVHVSGRDRQLSDQGIGRQPRRNQEYNTIESGDEDEEEEEEEV